MTFLILAEELSSAQEELSFADIIIRYAFYGAIIIIGLIALAIIKRCSRPPTPAKIEEKCAAVKKQLQIMNDSAANEKYSELASRRIKVYSAVNRMIYDSTKIIDDEQDVTMEDVRTSLQKILYFLDENSFSAFSKEELLSSCKKSLEEIDKADKLLAVIAERKKRFGR